MRSKMFFFLFFLILIIGIIAVFAMGKRPIHFKSIYINDEKRYGKDIVYWDGHWFRAMYRVNRGIIDKYPPDYIGPYNEEDIIIDITAPNVELPTEYKRKDLVQYCCNITSSGKKFYKTYIRRNSKHIIVTDKELNRPYVRLAKFTVGGPTPPKWRTVKRHIQIRAAGSFGADAVLLERWEVLPFKQEDYFPITEFREKEFVRYHCLAVAFEETAEIPEHLKYVSEEEANKKGRK